LTNEIRFLIVDAYSKKSRDALENVNMILAHILYQQMIHRHLPNAKSDVWLPSDMETDIPSNELLNSYSGILWTGCDLCINATNSPSIKNQLELAGLAFERGIPSFGSCWALQIAAVAAGGEVIINPNGREMGLARKIRLTEAGLKHPMYTGKPPVFEAFSCHDDIVLKLPEGGIHLAANEWSPVQGAAIDHKNGSFWAVQYHPEYSLQEMLCLIIARAPKLIELGFYKNQTEVDAMVNSMKALIASPHEKSLRWQLVIDDDVMDADIRQIEFSNWLKTFIHHRLMAS